MHRFLSLCVLVTLLAIPLYSFGQYEHNNSFSPSSILKDEGIDPESSDAVLHAIRAIRYDVSLAAVSIAVEKKDIRAIPIIVSVINSITEDQFNILSFYTYWLTNALAKFGLPDEEWMPTCKKILLTRNPEAQIRAAGLLAAHGDASGWSIVRNALNSRNQAIVLEATLVAKNFHGLKVDTPEGEKQIDIVEECIKALLPPDIDTQTWLIRALSQVTTNSEYDTTRIKKLIGQVKHGYDIDSIERLLNKLEKVKDK